MTNIDERIRRNLDEDDRAFLASLDERGGLFHEISGIFYGPLKPIVIYLTGLTFLLAALGFYASWGFIQAQGTESMLRWGALAWAAWTVVSGIKRWLWDRANLVGLLREVKRLELRVAMLAEEKGR